jgi:ethanolamine ammonia-lyase small subunit
MLPTLVTLKTCADLGVAQDLLAELGREQALGGLLEVVGDVVDDLVRADLDALLLGERAGLARGDDVEADDDRLGRVGEERRRSR